MLKENTFFVTLVSVIAFRIPMSSIQKPRILVVGLRILCAYFVSGI